MDRYYGQGASARMSYREWMTARRLLTEEFLGVHLRQRAHEERETFKQTTAKLGRR